MSAVLGVVWNKLLIENVKFLIMKKNLIKREEQTCLVELGISKERNV
jgi:hypothetical protein